MSKIELTRAFIGFHIIIGFILIMFELNNSIKDAIGIGLIAWWLAYMSGEIIRIRYLLEKK